MPSPSFPWCILTGKNDQNPQNKSPRITEEETLITKNLSSRKAKINYMFRAYAGPQSVCGTIKIEAYCVDESMGWLTEFRWNKKEILGRALVKETVGKWFNEYHES